jgi:hypothetical protein
MRLGDIPQGSIVEWETTGTSWYGFGSNVAATGGYTCRGNWGRDS